MCWTMSGSCAPPKGCQGPVQGPCLASYHWHHYSRPWRRYHSEPTPQQLSDTHKWKTSAHLAPRTAKMSSPEGKGHIIEALHPRLPNLSRFSIVPTDRARDWAREGQVRPGPLLRTFPYLRSMSEPATGSSPERTALRQVVSNAHRRAPSVGSFFHSFSRRISRVLRDEPQMEGGESGRRDSGSPGFMWCWASKVYQLNK